MKFVNLYYLLVVLLLASSCKKTSNVIAPEPLPIRDSISFAVNGKTYFFTKQNSIGIGNRQVNIKPYTTLLSDQDWEYKTGGFYWYGEKDSTLYDTFYQYSSQKDYTFQISFSKKFHNNQLRKSWSTLLVPADNSSLFKLGAQAFAVDLNLENTMDGISVEFQTKAINGLLTSYIPAFSVLIRPNLPNTIQDDSRFEITRAEKLDDESYLIEAKFTLNLFDENAKPYRLENGFLRFKTKMKVADSFEPANVLR